MYSTIPIHWNIKSAPASPGRSRVGPAFYVFSFLGRDQRPCINRHWTHAILCLGWLDIFLKWSGGGSCKGCALPQPVLRAAQLWYEVYSSCGEEGLQCNVLYRRRPLNFQYPVRAEPLVFLSSLWAGRLLPLSPHPNPNPAIHSTEHLWTFHEFSSPTICEYRLSSRFLSISDNWKMY